MNITGFGVSGVWKRCLSGLLAVGALSFAGGVSAAPKLCFPPIQGVPGNQSAPDFGVPDIGVLQPNWRGAFSVSDGDQTGSGFWALKERDASTGADYLDFAWDISNDPVQGDDLTDALWLGLADPTGGTNWAYIFQISRPAAQTTTESLALPAGANVIQRVFVYSHAKLLWEAWDPAAHGGSVFPWPTMKGWFDLVCDPAPTSLCKQRTIRLRIPSGATTTTGVPTASGFKLWYELDSTGGTAGILPHTFPSGVPVLGLTAPFNLPNSTETIMAGWADMQLQASTGAPCGVGITLGAASDIKVQNSKGLDQVIAPYENNTFTAAPVNGSGGDLSGAAVKARFRIANWGSVAKTSATWSPISTQCNAASGSSSVTVSANSKFNLACSWNLSGDAKGATNTTSCDYDDSCDYLGPLTADHPSHQCILVDLSAGPSAPMGPLVFTTASIYRNFNFDHSSQITKKALIDIGGTGPMPLFQRTRDVFLYVKTTNMSTPQQLSGDQISPVGAYGAATLKAQLDQGALTVRDVQRQMASYTVYVTRDSGKGVWRGLRFYPIYESQPSFGVFPYHDGLINGWMHALTGPGIQQIATNYYRVPVLINGSTNVTVNIVSDESISGQMCPASPFTQWPWGNWIGNPLSSNPFPWNAWPRCWWNWTLGWLGLPTTGRP